MNLKSIISEFSKKYGQNAAKMEKRVLEYISGGISAETAIKRAFADTGLLTDLTADIQAAKMQAVSLGIGYDATGNTEITTALNRPWDGTGVTFSQRIHLGGEQMRTAMVDEIKSQLKLGASAVDVARSLYDGYGYGHIQTKQAAPDYLAEIVAFARRSDLTEKEKQKLLRQIRLTQQAVDNLSQNGAPNQALKTAYSKLLEAVQENNQANINKAVSVAINEKSRYVAERIARTEAGRAYFDGVIAQYKDNPLVIAYKWELASRHPAEDICDMYAGADLFGLGPGIFPKEICPPMPAHPNCLCLLYPVLKGEADLTKQATSPKAGGISWLQAHPEAAKNILPVNSSADNWLNVARGFSGFSNPVSRLKSIISETQNQPNDVELKESRRTYGTLDGFNYKVQQNDEYELTGKETGKVKIIPKNEGNVSKIYIAPDCTGFLGNKYVGDKNMLAILTNGRIVVNNSTGNKNLFMRVKTMLQNEIDIMAGLRKDNIWYRGTDNSKELGYLKKKTIKASVNHMTNTKEDGLSVWETPKYGFKYTYQVKGDLISIGSDGEPIIDIKSVELVSNKSYNTNLVNKLREEGKKKFCEKYQWTAKQLDDALNWKLQTSYL